MITRKFKPEESKNRFVPANKCVSNQEISTMKGKVSNLMIMFDVNDSKN